MILFKKCPFAENFQAKEHIYAKNIMQSVRSKVIAYA